MSDAEGQQPDPATVRATPAWLGEVVTAAAYGMVFVAAVLLALLGSFHIADRPKILGGHWPVAVVVAVVGNLVLGTFAGWGLRGRAGAGTVFAGWIIGVGLVMFGGSDDVVIGGSPGDWVPLGFLVGGVVAGVVAVVVSVRFVDPAARPWLASPGGRPGPKSSLRASGRR